MEEELASQAQPIRSITYEKVKKMTDKVLLFWYYFLPGLYKLPAKVKKKRGFTVEDLVNLYIMVVNELNKRKVKYKKKDTAIDRHAKKFKSRVKKNNSLESENEQLPQCPFPILLKDAFKEFPDKFSTDDFICIIGGVAERGESDNDLDILVRQDYCDERIENAILDKLPRGLASKVHFVYAQNGPHDKFVGIYKREFVKVKELKIKSLDEAADLD